MKNTHTEQNTPSVRLDKWLWAARLFKTRAIARDAVQSGKIQYNGQRAKPSRNVEVGATLKVPAGFDIKEVVINEVFDKRRSASQVEGMYTETPASIATRERNAQARKLSVFHSPRPDSKPDKKQRRKIISLKHQ